MKGVQCIGLTIRIEEGFIVEYTEVKLFDVDILITLEFPLCIILMEQTALE